MERVADECFSEGAYIYKTFRPQKPKPEQLNHTRSFSQGSGSDLIHRSQLPTHWDVYLWVVIISGCMVENLRRCLLNRML